MAALPGWLVRPRLRFGRGPAFTLVEMLVSLAILALALTIIGMVFAITTNTTRQAAAYSEAQNWLRQCMEQIENDLNECDPANSILVLVGRTQAASLTQEHLAAGRYYRVLIGNPADVPAGYDPQFAPNLDNSNPLLAQYSNPRADLLMFFSSRQVVSQAPPVTPPPAPGSFAEACLKGAKLGPIEVVYGHAAFIDPVLNNGTYQIPPDSNDTRLRHIEQQVGGSYNPNRSVIPASRWHLARRATIIEPLAVGSNPKLQFTQGEFERILRCVPDNTPAAGDTAQLDLPTFLTYFGYEIDPQNPTNHVVLVKPYNFANWPGGLKSRVLNVLYPGGSETNHHVATIVENPPAELMSNLGVQMLPGCAWFQVEFLMPEDPRNSLDYAPNPPAGPPQQSQRQDMPLWTQVQAGQTYVFVPDTAANRERVSMQDPMQYQGGWYNDFAWVVPPSPPSPPGQGGPDSVSNRRIRMWPYAIRITVRVFDPKGRLAAPIIRSLVHRFE